MFIFPTVLFGQNSKPILNDFNYDGYIDTLSSTYEHGSGFGETYVEFINGKTITVITEHNPQMCITKKQASTYTSIPKQLSATTIHERYMSLI